MELYCCSQDSHQGLRKTCMACKKNLRLACERVCSPEKAPEKSKVQKLTWAMYPKPCLVQLI
jgi:hypothetical protein